MPRHPHEPVTPTLPFPPVPPAPPCGCTPPRMRPEPFSPGGLPAPHGFDFGRWAREKIGWLLSLVPSAASPDNQLADREWVAGQAVAGKADKVADAAEGNLAGLDSEGNLTDSGAKPADFATAAQGAKADTAVQPAAIAGFVDGAEYDAEYGTPPKPTILLKHGDEVVATVDAADFVIDGMVSDVEVKNGYLVITFNTDSGKQPISIPLTDIFDPANYYTKTEANALLAGKASKADATLDYRWEINPATSPSGYTYGVYWRESYQTWMLRVAPDEDRFLNIGFDAMSFSEEVDGITITGTRSLGYQLGSQSDKPLASEAEAEALRQGKQDALSAQQLANIAAVSDALAFDVTHSYGAGDPVVYNGTLYTFTATHTGAWTGSDVSAVDIIARLANKLDKSGGTVTGPLTLYEPQNGANIYFPSAGKAKLYFGSRLFEVNDETGCVTIKGNAAAVTADIPYDLGTPTVIDTASSEVVEGQTVYYGAATLVNRTANIVQVTAATALDELRITFPAATSGKVRDFGLRVEVGTGSAALAAPALVPIAPTGETIKLENAAGTIPELADGTATAKGVTLLYFSENAPGVFVVKGEQVEEVA